MFKKTGRVPNGPQDGGMGHGVQGVVSVSVDLLRAVACLFLGRFSNHLKFYHYIFYIREIFPL